KLLLHLGNRVDFSLTMKSNLAYDFLIAFLPVTVECLLPLCADRLTPLWLLPCKRICVFQGRTEEPRLFPCLRVWEQGCPALQIFRRHTPNCSSDSSAQPMRWAP